MENENVLMVAKNPEGRIFTLYGNKEELKQWADQFINWDKFDGEDEDNEYSLQNCDKSAGNGEPFTLEERNQDIEELKKVLQQIEDNIIDVFIRAPRKKNGSLAKNRVTTLWRGTTFQHYWEDSYGWNAPELSIKNVDDYKADLQCTSRVEHY